MGARTISSIALEKIESVTIEHLGFSWMHMDRLVVIAVGGSRIVMEYMARSAAANFLQAVNAAISPG